MILTIDVGNSHLVLGCYDGEHLALTERISTDTHRTGLEYAVIFKAVFRLHHVPLSALEGAVISSVVPSMTTVLRDALAKIAPDIPIFKADSSTPANVPLLIDNPEQAGSDLVITATAAHEKYGAPVIVIQFGTATTLSLVDVYGCYLGGAILPGVELSLHSLVSGTSQLPGISLQRPAHVLGTNTVDSMRSGVIFGNAAAIDGMIDRIWKERGYASTALVATGDLAQTVIPCCRHNIIVDTELPLLGLRIIYDFLREEDAPCC